MFSFLGQGLIANGHRRVLAQRLFRHRPDHWSMTIRDHSPLNQYKSRKDYLLRSEILGVTSIIYRQMNEIRWDPSKYKYTEPELIYSGGPLIVKFIAHFSSFLDGYNANIPLGHDCDLYSRQSTGGSGDLRSVKGVHLSYICTESFL